MGRNLVLNPNQVLSSSELAARDAGLILKVLLNPTSGRDASYSCLISTWPKEGCTIVCVMCCSGRGVPFGATKPCSWSKSQKLSPKADNTFNGQCPQKRLFMREDLFQACTHFVRFGAEEPARLCSLQTM